MKIFVGILPELVWTNFALPSRIYRHLWRGIIRAGEENVSVSEKLHPHQKPIGLLSWIMDYSGIDRGPILDPYCGSGSTLVAAARKGFPAIGIEIEERYCEIAAKRLIAPKLSFPVTGQGATDGATPQAANKSIFGSTRAQIET